MNYHPFRKLVRNIMNRKQESYERKSRCTELFENCVHELFIESSKTVNCVEVVTYRQNRVTDINNDR